MVKLKNAPLGQDGIKYIESCLNNGGTGLCLRLLEFPLSKGKAYVPVPESTSATRARNFGTGGLMSMTTGQNWLAEHVQVLASKNPAGTLVFQNVWGAKPGDASIKNTGSKKFFNQSDVYYFVEATEVNSDLVITMLREGTSFLRIGAFIDCPVLASELPVSRFVDDFFIADLAKHAKEIYVSAYDQEGFVVWLHQ